MNKQLSEEDRDVYRSLLRMIERFGSPAVLVPALHPASPLFATRAEHMYSGRSKKNKQPKQRDFLPAEAYQVEYAPP